jgi:hypothetical protein
MGYPGSRPSSIVPLLTRWRLSLDDDPPRLADALRSEAERCFRLAQGIASFELADELEAIGRAFESEAEDLQAAAKPPGSAPTRCNISPPRSRAA